MYPVHRESNHLLLKHLKSYHEFYGSNERGGNDTVKYYGFFWSDFLWGEPLKKKVMLLVALLGRWRRSWRRSEASSQCSFKEAHEGLCGHMGGVMELFRHWCVCWTCIRCVPPLCVSECVYLWTGLASGSRCGVQMESERARTLPCRQSVAPTVLETTTITCLKFKCCITLHCDA